MANLPSMLKSFSSFLQNNQVSFTNGLLILFTVGGEQIFRFTAFQCPCTQPLAQVYACSFIFGPALVLGILGVVVNNLTWRLCHGFHHRSQKYKYTCCETTEHSCAILSRACIVPFAWLFITFLDGNYIVCMLSSTPCNTTAAESSRLLRVSQISSWVLLVIVVAGASLVIFCSRYCDTVSYMQNKYATIYREVEGVRFEESMKKTADEHAKINIGMFMDYPQLKKEDWDSISKAADHRVKQETYTQLPSFSPLQKWSYAKLVPVTKETPGIEGNLGTGNGQNQAEA